MKGLNKVFKGFLFLLLAGLLTGAATLPLSAQVTIPYGSTIHSAHFSIYQIAYEYGQTVWVHPITSGWSELGVTWNSFAGSYDPFPVGLFTIVTKGWKTVEITDLVRAWINGTRPNYGILLRQDMTHFTIYHSSESTETTRRPKLVISYTPPGGVLTEITIQRPGADFVDVADAMIWVLAPDRNYGNYTPLYTGLVNGGEKQSLIKFYIDVTPPSVGTGTPGYWRNHPAAWPVDSIDIGGIVYSKSDAIAIMSTAPAGDMTYVMFAALVSAKLNVLMGNVFSCIADELIDADNWMTAHPVGSGVAGRSTAWKIGEPLYKKLDDYNNGLLCAPSRDSLEY